MNYVQKAVQKCTKDPAAQKHSNELVHKVVRLFTEIELGIDTESAHQQLNDIFICEGIEILHAAHEECINSFTRQRINHTIRSLEATSPSLTKQH